MPFDKTATDDRAPEECGRGRDERRQRYGDQLERHAQATGAR
jgi:hypothetical protein